MEEKREFTEILESITRDGLRIDWDVLTETKTSVQKEVDILAEDIKKQTGILNANSSKQCAEYFHIKKEIPVIKTTGKGAVSVDADVLGKLEGDFPIAGDIIKARSKGKLLSLIKSLEKTYAGSAYIHPEYSIGKTGRVFFKSPNITGFTPEIREAVIPDEGRSFIYFDWASAELIILATLAGEDAMVDKLRWGEDIHSATAEYMGCSRTEAKTFTYAIIYGACKEVLMQETGLSEQDINKYLHDFGHLYPGMLNYLRTIADGVIDTGNSQTLHGRIMPYDPTDSRSMKRCINHVVQGTCADLLVDVSLQLMGDLKQYHPKIKALVFDAILIEVDTETVDEAVIAVEDSASLVGDFSFRVEVGSGDNWKDAVGKGDTDGDHN